MLRFLRNITIMTATGALVSCGSSSTPAVSLPQAKQVIAAAPVVGSRGTMRKYVNLFKTACLDQSPKFAGTDAVLTANGFKRVAGTPATSGKGTAAYTDGVAYASYRINAGVNDGCNVALKTRDDDPLLADLKAAVANSQFSAAQFSRGGLFGASFTIKRGNSVKTLIALGRNERSAQSPTQLSLINLR